MFFTSAHAPPFICSCRTTSVIRAMAPTLFSRSSIPLRRLIVLPGKSILKCNRQTFVFSFFCHLTSTCMKVTRRARKTFSRAFVCGDWLSTHMRMCEHLTRVSDLLPSCRAKCISRVVQMSIHFAHCHVVCITPLWGCYLRYSCGSGGLIYQRGVALKLQGSESIEILPESVVVGGFVSV